MQDMQDMQDAITESGDGIEWLFTLAERWRLLIFGSLAVGVLAAGLSYLIPPIYTARTSFLPPQQVSNAGASAALASLSGNLGGLAGMAGGALRTPTDQYVSLLRSVTITDRIIDQFKLMDLYGVDMRMKARRILVSQVQIAAGKRDNLITVEVDDKSPQRAAEIANRYVEELRRLTGQLALTEAQQRRLFFEQQLSLTKQKLTLAQQELLASGYSDSTLKAEPKAAAEGFAKLRAELTAAEVRLQALRSQFREQTPEVEQQSSIVAALRANLTALQRSDGAPVGPDYVSRFREFKYQETLFDMFSRQYEIARVDESREGAAIQVIDPALPPEFKSKPTRSLIAVGATLLSFVLLVIWVFTRAAWRRFAADPANTDRLAQWRAAQRQG